MTCGTCLVEDVWVTDHIWPMNMILLYLKISYYIHYQDIWYPGVHIYICIFVYMYNRIHRAETIMSIHDWSWLIVIIHSTDFWSFQFAAMVESLAMQTEMLFALDRSPCCWLLNQAFSCVGDASGWLYPQHFLVPHWPWIAGCYIHASPCLMMICPDFPWFS